MERRSLQGPPELGDKTFAALVFCAGLLRLGILFRLPESGLIQYLPDDAFYYLTPARNFAALGRWTFDGVEPSSGLHVLWGYLLALYFHIVPNSTLHMVFAVAGFFQVCCLALAAYLVADAGHRMLRQSIVPGVGIVFLSAACLSQAGWLMESAVTILASAAVIWLLARERIDLRPGVMVGAALLGFFLMMSRSDSGLLALVLFLTLVILWKRRKVEASMAGAGTLVLAGSVVGLLTTLFHTHWVSGKWVQSSAQQKIFWTSVMPHGLPLMDTLYVIATIFNPLFNEKVILANILGSAHAAQIIILTVRLLVLAAIGWGLYGALRKGKGSAANGLLLGLIASLLLYAAFYTLDAAVQEWYVANLAAPAALLSGSAVAYLVGRKRRPVYTAAAVLCVTGFVFSLTPTFEYGEVLYRSGVYLHNHPEIDHAGAFNAGIVGFFAHRNVTNLDGLVNDRILVYARSGNLAQYMIERHIDYILESPQIFYDWMPRRGGYADGKVHRCIDTAVDLFPDDPNNNYIGERIRLYHLNMNCLATN